MLQKVVIHGLVLDPITQWPILVLKEEAASRLVPIWIGTSEANAIALELESIKVPRPMTHDLLCGILEKVHAPIKEVRITDVRDNTYFADLVLSPSAGELHVDARPSDAIALALRAHVPIFVEESIFEKCYELEDNTEALRQWLEKLSPEEMGRFEM
ncbi:MAG: bifunctional nuclease family protein [Acidobacteriota bacterium]